MGARVKIGCAQNTVGGKAYWADFGAFELPDLSARRVKQKTLETYHSDAPAASEFIITLPSVAFEDEFAGARFESAWSSTVQACVATAAHTILLRTPPNYRPTAARKERLLRFVDSARSDELRFAWAPGGLWLDDLDEVFELSQRGDMVAVMDPLGDDEMHPLIAEQEVIYWRLMGRRGMTGGFSDYEFDLLLEVLSTGKRGHIIFSAPSMLGDARRFARLLRAQGLEEED